MSAPQPQPKSKLKGPWDTLVLVLMMVGVIVFVAWLHQPGNLWGLLLPIIGLGMGFVWLVMRIPLGIFIGLILFLRKR